MVLHSFLMAGKTHGIWLIGVSAMLAVWGTGQKAVQVPPQPPEATQVYSLSTSISVELPADWNAAKSEDAPPPASLAPYAPPFHFSQVLTLSNPKTNAILLLGLSDNPFLEHDSNWFDGQMHEPSGSGMSMLDLLFYFFFPPSHACLDDVL